MPTIRLLTTAEALPDELGALHRLLLDVFDGDFTAEDWDHTLGGRHIVVMDGDVLVAHAAVVARVLEVGGHPLRAGYVEAVATTRARRGVGLGSLLMGVVSDLVQRDFEMGGLATDRHSFYARLGWERWQGPTYARYGTEAVRTPEEDDAVMVLRFGPSAAVDVTAPISCDSRPGDDW